MVNDEREKQIVDNIGLVHSIAHRFSNRGIEYEDLFQAGCVGLIKAVDNYDDSRGFMFSTYAVPVIMGEIKRIFRDCGSVKVSRTLKEKSMYVQKMRECFKSKEFREPTVSELAKLCNTDVYELSELLNLITPPLSLSAYYDEENSELDVPFDESEKIYNRLTVSYLMNSLSEKERKLIYLRFFEEKTQYETAKELNISQVQVSRREKAILIKLRSKMND